MRIRSLSLSLQKKKKKKKKKKKGRPQSHPSLIQSLLSRRLRNTTRKEVSCSQQSLPVTWEADPPSLLIWRSADSQKPFLPPGLWWSRFYNFESLSSRRGVESEYRNTMSAVVPALATPILVTSAASPGSRSSSTIGTARIGTGARLLLRV
ncbi:hypothetical protein BKA81DRAFT_92640 [Phyllosticta paracitricarpa]